jgi:hypothetical protein
MASALLNSHVTIDILQQNSKQSYNTVFPTWPTPINFYAGVNYEFSLVSAAMEIAPLEESMRLEFLCMRSHSLEV